MVLRCRTGLTWDAWGQIAVSICLMRWSCYILYLHSKYHSLISPVLSSPTCHVISTHICVCMWALYRHILIWMAFVCLETLVIITSQMKDAFRGITRQGVNSHHFFVSLYVCMYVYMCMCMHAYVCMYVNIHVLHIHTYIHIHVYAYIQSLCVCVCICLIFYCIHVLVSFKCGVSSLYAGYTPWLKTVQIDSSGGKTENHSVGISTALEPLCSKLQ